MELLGVNIWFWVLVVMIVLELLTTALVSIWFCVGAIAARSIVFMGCGTTAQVFTFVLVSLISLVLFRPVVKKLKKPNKESMTNIDGLIGRKALVTESINNIRECGEVRINGQLWSARSFNEEEICKDRVVVIQKIEGVKLIVREMEE